MTWTTYAILGLISVSAIMALYKVPAAKNINKYGLSFWSYFFASIIAGFFLYPSVVFDLKTLAYAFVWGTGFTMLSLAQMQALHKNDTSGVYPFTSLVSNILIVIGGVLLLNEIISPLQWIAICASVILFTAAQWNNRIHFVANVLPLFAFIALLSTFNKFVQKFGADSVETYNFIFWQLVFALVASFVIMLYTKKQTTFEELAHRHLLKWAVIIGVLQFTSTYTITKALSLGPISIISVILGLYTFFTSIFAVILFKEKITRKAILVIFASFLIVLLIKLG